MSHKDLLIPVKKGRRLAGHFSWGRLTTVYSDQPSDDLPLRQLRKDLAELGIRPRRVGSPERATLRVLRDRRVTNPEAYRLAIRRDGIEIRALGAAGAYYAVQTLRDLLALHGRTLPTVTIEDAPDFRRRGVYHDCSRGKVPKVKTVKNLIQRLAHWKINELQLYIENTFKYQSHPAIGRGYSPFTGADILAIQEYAKQHHVRLVGSLASFGHMEKILMLPEYQHLAEATDFRRDAKGDLCPTDPGSIKLLADLYGEFLPLLEAEDFNACCDETRQIGQGRSRKRAQRIGLGRLYLEFVLKIRRVCRKHGKRLNIWGDIVLAHPEIIPEVPRDIVMLNWDYSANGSRIDRTDEFARAGLPLVCCPGTNAWQSHGTRMRQAVENVSRFARIAREFGSEGLLNTDWGDYGHRNTLGVSLHSFAHGAAHAWNGAAVDERRFLERFCSFTFGDRSGKLASALRLLGAYPRGDLYHGLTEPFDPDKPMLGYRVIGNLRPEARLIRRRLDEMEALRIPRPSVPGAFEALALAEFDLARRMDLLACRRLLAGRDARRGKAVSPCLLRALAREMRSLSEEFAEVWRSRNKPSRLRDNLKAMRYTIAEAEMLAR